MWLGCQVTERPSKKLLQETPAQAVLFLFVCISVIFVFLSSVSVKLFYSCVVCTVFGSESFFH